VIQILLILFLGVAQAQDTPSSQGEPGNKANIEDLSRRIRQLRNDSARLKFENTFTSSMTIKEAIKVTTVTANAFVLTCPQDIGSSTFTALSALGRTLICCQTDEEGSGTWEAANNDCFQTYGGRLCSTSELHLCFDNAVLNDETDDSEWTSDFTEDGAGVFEAIRWDGDASPKYAVGDVTGSRAYRCCIPR